MRYQLIEFSNNRFGVKDTKINMTVAAGMDKTAAQNWADRLNLRDKWGI